MHPLQQASFYKPYSKQVSFFQSVPYHAVMCKVLLGVVPFSKALSDLNWCRLTNRVVGGMNVDSIRLQLSQQPNFLEGLLELLHKDGARGDPALLWARCG